MLPISRLSIVNQALIEIARLPVTNINDSEDAIFLNAKIDIILPVLLEETLWNFAVKYKQDNTPITVPFSEDYTYTYQLPSDYGHMYSWGTFNANFSEPGSMPFLITDGLISTNQKPITYYYIISDVDVSAISTMFYRALILYVASDSCLALTNDMEMTKYLNAKYEEARSKAYNRNDMERYITSKPNNDYDRVITI